MYRVTYEVLAPQAIRQHEARRGKFWSDMDDAEKTGHVDKWLRPEYLYPDESEAIARAQVERLQQWRRNGSHPVRDIQLEHGEIQWSEVA